MLITLGRGMAPTSSTETTPFTLPPSAPSTDYYIVVLDGQSNMVGYGTPYDAQLDATDPRILQLSRTGTDVSAETLILAQDQLDHHEKPGNSIGMGMTYAKQILQDHPNSNVILIPAAKGATGFTNGWQDGAGLTEDLIARTNKAIELAQALGSVELHSILRHQGEANTNMSITEYSQYLYNHITRMRDEITIADTTTPVIMGDLAQNGGVVAPTATSIRNVFHDIKTNMPYAGFAPSDNISVEPTFTPHFDAIGQRAFALVYYAQYINGLSSDLNMSAPNAVNDLSANVISETEIGLAWSAPNDNGSPIVNYIIEYKLSSDTTWTEFYDSTTPTLSVTITGLTQDSEYSFRVRVVNAAAISNASNIVTETPIANSPPTGGNINLAAYPNLFVYDVTDPANYTASGGEVSQVNDIGGNNFHATQIAPASNPQEGVVNGINGVEFLSGDRLLMPNTALTNDALTIFTAYVTPAADAFQFIVASQGGDNVWSMNQAARMGGGQNISTSPQKPVNTPIVQAAYVDSAGAGITQYLKVNDNNVVSNATNFTGNPVNINLATWNGGGFNFVGTLFFAACYVGLTDAQRNEIGNELAAKINGTWTDI